MNDYNFSTLNDKEFENLSIELISKDKGKRFERFKAGRDAGIDGRFCHDDGTQEIIQCKHYLKSGFSGLMSSLKKKNDKGINESDKVNKLAPLSYIFATSLPLSAENKKTIREFFTPNIKNDNDIYGQEDLNQILGNNPDIEKKYYKLWLSSTVVLERIFNNAIESRSEFLLEDIKEKLKYYVVTKNHYEAIAKIEKSHIIVIAGEPGIGKTTLAEHIALFYIEKGFKFYNIENSINEAENIYKKGEPQIFYFDDFLGSNYLNVIENKKDSHIIKFMNRVKRDKKKRFILTSRTNIFYQGLELSDTFKSENIKSEEFILNINSLEDIDKAKILYNHIWHSNLDESFIDEIYIDKRYKKIIKHKNFNPRLIAFVTDVQKIQIENIEANNYWDYIVKKFDNPQDIWANTFDKGSNDFIRSLVILTVFNGNKIEENKLKESYIKYIKLVGLSNTSHTSNEFDSIIKEIVKYFLNRNQTYSKKIEYTLFNPSIADFILMRYKNNFEILKNVFKALENYMSLNKLFNMKEKKIPNDVYIAILEELQKDAQLQQDTNYLIKLNYLINRDCPKNIDFKLLKNLIQDIIDGRIWTILAEELDILVNLFNSSEFNINDIDFLYALIPYSYSDIDELNSVIRLYNYFDVSDTKIENDINEAVAYNIKEKLQEEADSIYEYDVQFEESLDEDGLFKIFDGEVEQIIDDKYSELESEIEYFKGLSIYENDIKNEIDIDEIEQRLSSDYTSEKYKDYVNEEGDSESRLSDERDDIENLFKK